MRLRSLSADTQSNPTTEPNLEWNTARSSNEHGRTIEIPDSVNAYVKRRHVHTMTTGKWLPWTTALLAHAALVSAIVLCSRAPQARVQPDFVAEAGLFHEEDIPAPPGAPEQFEPVGP